MTKPFEELIWSERVKPKPKSPYTQIKGENILTVEPKT